MVPEDFFLSLIVQNDLCDITVRLTQYYTKTTMVWMNTFELLFNYPKRFKICRASSYKGNPTFPIKYTKQKKESIVFSFSLVKEMYICAQPLD